MTPRLAKILETLSGHHGRENAISAHELALRTGIAERDLRRELEEAYAEGVLEEHEIPAVGIPGVGFFLATHVEDFQAAYNQSYRVRRALDRKLDGIKRLAAVFGFHLLKTEP